MTFKEIYQTPFRTCNDGMYAISNNGTKALTGFSIEAQAHVERIVRLLNGEAATKYDKNDVIVQDTKLCVCGHIIIVRGWGRLTGIGGYNIPHDEAAKIQDDFINWIVETITK